MLLLSIGRYDNQNMNHPRRSSLLFLLSVKIGRQGMVFLLPGLLLLLQGCNQYRYQPADWRVTDSSTTLPQRIEGGGGGTTLPGRGTTLPGRGTTLPGRGTTLPARGTTLPGRGTTLPLRGSTLPMRGIGGALPGTTLPAGRLLLPPRSRGNSTTLPGRN